MKLYNILTKKRFKVFLNTFASFLVATSSLPALVNAQKNIDSYVQDITETAEKYNVKPIASKQYGYDNFYNEKDLNQHFFDIKDEFDKAILLSNYLRSFYLHLLPVGEANKLLSQESNEHEFLKGTFTKTDANIDFTKKIREIETFAENKENLYADSIEKYFGRSIKRTSHLMSMTYYHLVNAAYVLLKEIHKQK